MAEAIVGAIAPNIFGRCVGAAGEHLGYIWNYKKNIANLQTRVEKLDEERDDKRHSVTVAVKNAHKIKNRVKGWQDETDKISEEAMQIIKDYEEKGKKRCLMGLCPNLVSRYQFSKRACKKELEIVDAINEAGAIREVSDRSIGLGKESALSTESCFTFDSRKPILEDIMKTLQDETKNSVGMYGLGGMGKTTLAKQVASQVTKKMFEEVVMASVTQKVDMKEIQGQIASMLDLKLEESSVAERASRIHERLKGKKVLVILDDLWTKLDLIQVGIPFGAEHMGCKILLTSRFLHVLSSMGTRKEYVLGALKEDEAWRLFEEKVIHIVKNPKFLTVGKKVARRCAGLPILIVTVAASLAKRPDLDAWNDTLAQVKRMNNKNMHDIVNSVIESISYECLNETHKRLFLLCGLMQGYALFEDILKYSLGWDLFGEEEIVTVEGARNRLHALIFDLKESCLLLDGDAGDHIQMHDVVRDVAISIARKDLNAFSAGDNDTDLSRWPRNDVLQKCTAMVFSKKLPSFPQRLECPSLELFVLITFFMGSKPTIPDTLFERTSKLKVLDMTRMCFPTLPSSLSFLTNLQSLHLDYCDGLQDISMVGELKKLQVLSLAGSTIQELPSSLGQLSELKLLDLNSCSQLKVIPAGLIASLSQLEELHMSESFDRWKAEECFINGGRSNASLGELKCLRNLTGLKVQLRDAKLLAENLNFENWKRFEIIVGDVWDWSFRDWFETQGIKTIIALQLGTNSINHLQHEVDTLFKRTECLCLQELNDMNNVIPGLNEDGFLELKHLRIVRDSKIQYIVNVEDKQHKACFPALESLHLNGLRKVEKICNAGLMEGSFHNLTIVKVKNCNRLESLFSFSTIIALPCLQDIKVSSCDVLEEIVAKKRKEEDDDVNSTSDVPREKIELAQLRKLALKCLPKIMTFNGEDIPMVKRRQKLLASEMESEEIIAEEGLEGEFASFLPLFEEVSFPKLEELELCGMFNIREIWSHKLPEVDCCNLTEMTVTNCDNLKYLFTPSHATVLVGLQRLTVEECLKMKQVVAREEGETKAETIIFPQLSSIRLYNLPNLTTFHSGLVEEMTTKEKVETVTQTLFDEKVQFPSLKTLFIQNLDSIRAIWPNTMGITQSMKTFSSTKSTTTQINLKDKPQEIPIFQNLSEVTIIKCESLKFVFPAFVARSLNQLVKVCVEDCGVETIIGDDEDIELENSEARTTTFTFPKLVTIKLKGLSKMECFYPREHTIEWPALKVLEVVACDKLNVLDFLRSPGKQGDDIIVEVPASMSMKKSCMGLKYLFTPSVAMSLENVQKLTIAECSMMKAIVGNEGGEAIIDKITFPQLIHLSLQDLPNFRRFHSKVEEMDLNQKIDYDVQPLFTEKVSFPQLEELELSGMSNLREIWSDKLPEVACCNLTTLTVTNCDNLKYLFTPSIASGLDKVRKLAIRKCSMMKAIVGHGGEAIIDSIIFPQLIHLSLEDLSNLTSFYSTIQDMDSNEKLDSNVQPLFQEKIQFPRLEKLNVVRLDNINTIWQSKQLYEVVSFCKLEEVTVDKCESLKYVFPASMAGPLNQLKTMKIKDCGMETIIGDDEELKEMGETFTFFNLATIHLYRLPNLKCFYPREHTVNWPTLQELNVVDCNKFPILDLVDFAGKQGNDQIIKVISSLKCLSIKSKELSALFRLCDLFQPRLSLTELTICEFHGELSTFPSKFLDIIHHKLETLQVHNCSFQEIFPYEGDDTDHVNDDVLFPQLTKLVLEKLPELEYICKQDQYSSFILNIFNKLEDLCVTECPRLKNLVPPFVSFRLLRELTLVNCGGLINLFQPSTARSLEQLWCLDISECEMIEEIIGEVRDDDEETSSSCREDGIIFNKLEYLNLEKLPSLAHFSSSHNYTFNFPKLDTVYVVECPNMKTFCGGITTTPELNKVYLTNSRSEERWEGELNTTVHKIYEEREAERLATTLPSVLATNHSEAQTEEERVAGTCEKSTGKEVEVSGKGLEHFETSQTPRYSNPSCSNYTASSSQFSPQISNHLDEVIHLATQVEAQTAAAATISTAASSNQFEAQAEIHDMSLEKSAVKPKKESQIPRNCTEELGSKESEVCESVTMGPRKETKTCDQVVEMEAQGVTVTVPSTSSSSQFEQESERLEKSIEKFTEEGRISKYVIHELGTGTSLAASSSQQKDLKGSSVTKDSISLDEFVHILQAQAVNNVSAEQVEFVEDTVGLICTYIDKAKECLERKRTISELKLQIQALENENDAFASAAPRFG